MRAVVRKAADDGESRTAIRTIDERIEVAPVRGIEEFAQAIVAGGDIRENQGADRLEFFAGQDGEPGSAVAGDLGDLHIRDKCERGSVRREGAQEFGDACIRPLNFDDDSGRIVGDVAAQMMLAGEAVHVGPEPDALHDPRDADLFSKLHGTLRRREGLPVRPHAPFDPLLPLRQSLAGQAGDLDDFDTGMNPARVLSSCCEVEGHVR